jgi:SAM-dependent methyltransferase
LHDVLAASLPPLPAAPRILDAGCGFGGTMLDLASRLGATCVGVTLSAAQASVGARAAERAGLVDRVRFVIGSYDTPPPGPFDVVVAIESLAHSADPAVSLAALARVASPGGLLAIVDDMPEPVAEDSSDLAAFKGGWRCPVRWDRASYVRALSSLGATLLVDADLSSELRPRPLARIRALEYVNRACRALVPWDGWRGLMDSYYGGLALERMFWFKMMRYRLLIARISGV